MQTELKSIRLHNNLTQKQIANFLGVSVPAYSNYENNQREIPFEFLVNLSEFYKLGIAELVGLDKKYNAPYDQNVSNSIRLSKDFDVLISGNICTPAYNEIMSFVSYIKNKYGYPKP